MRERACIPRAADRLKFWNALIHRREKWRLCVRLCLIPVGHGIVVVGAVIGVAMFDGGANGFGERNWRIEMEAVDRGGAAGALLALHRRSVKGVGQATLPEIPCTKKIVLRASADDGRAEFVINDKHIDDLAPPAILVIQHGHW